VLSAGRDGADGDGAGSLVRAAATLAVEVHTGVQAAAERYSQELRRRWAFRKPQNVSHKDLDPWKTLNPEPSVRAYMCGTRRMHAFAMKHVLT
jgi:hypothetical protein